MNGKYTLVIDGNYFLFRTLFVLPGTFKSDEILGSSDDMAIYMRKLATDLTYQIRLFDGLIDKIVWTVDSRSWRKDFYPESEYKGNRKPNSNLNWDNFSKVSEEFKDILAKRGVCISKVDGAEGDDLIYAWVTESLANEKSIIIFSGDKDLTQLTGLNKNNKAHALCYSPVHKKIYTYPGFSTWLNSVDKATDSNDFFESMKVHSNQSNRIKETLKSVRDKKTLEYIETNPEEIRFKKVLTGDPGDNVPPAYWKNVKLKTGGERIYGVSDMKANSVYDEFIKKHGSFNYMYFFSDEYLTDIANILIKVVNIKDKSREEIIRNLRVNINLMILSSQTIPEGIVDEMFRVIESLSNCNLDLKSVTSMKALLKDTKYVDDITEQKGFSASFFKGDDSDDSDDMSFIKGRKQNDTLF